MANSLSFWFVLMSCFNFSNSSKFLCSCGVETFSDPHSPAHCQLTSAMCHIITKHTIFFIPVNHLFFSFIPFFYNSTDTNAGSQVYVHGFWAINNFEEAYSRTVGWGTVLQTRRLQVQFLIVSLELFIDIFLQAALGAWGQLSP